MKRANSGTARFTGPKPQRVNHISQEGKSENLEQEYQAVAESEVSDIDDKDQIQELNFLDIAPW